MKRFLGGIAAALYVVACFLPGEPSGGERIEFELDVAVPFRVPLAGTAEPAIGITAGGKRLSNPHYRLESLEQGVVRVDATGRGLEGRQRGAASVRLVYQTATATLDTIFPVQVVVSRIAVGPASTSLTRLGATTPLSATAYDAKDATVPNVMLTWSSADPQIATVNDTGLVRAISEGAVTITATADEVVGTSGVTVTQAAAQVLVAPGLDTLRTVQRSLHFIAVAFDSTGEVMSSAKARWSSINPAVATIDAAGLATAESAGVTKIIAQVGPAADTATLVVKQVLRFLLVSPGLDTLVAIDDTGRVAATGTDSLGSPIPNAVVTWITSDPKIASVDQAGLVRAAKNGVVLITAASGGQSAFATIVVRQEVARAQVSPEDVALTGAGATVQLSAVGLDQNGFVVDGVVFTWRSRNQFVATVNATGLVTAWGGGSASITASPVNGGQSDTATVTVTGAPPPAVIAFSANKGIEVMDADGSGRRPLVEIVCSHGGEHPAEGLAGCPFGEGWVPSGPAWSPDGKRLAFTLSFVSLAADAEYWSQIYVARADGSDTVNLTKNEFAFDQWPAWSPDGTKIAFGREGSIYVMNADGSNVTLVVRRGSDNFLRFPTWSPDGTRLAFDDLNHDVYVVAVNGTGLARLTDREGGLVPAWSPDGSLIAYIRYMTGGGDRIWLMHADGSGAINLTKDVPTTGDGVYAWSPDGLQIVFAGGDADGHKDLYTINRDGTGLRRLTTTSGESEDYPSWRPQR